MKSFVYLRLSNFKEDFKTDIRYTKDMNNMDYKYGYKKGFYKEITFLRFNFNKHE